MCGRSLRTARRPGADGRVSFGARIRTTKEVIDAVEWDAVAENTSISRILGRIVEAYYADRHEQIHSHKLRRHVPLSKY